jgi:hypothetical protein
MYERPSTIALIHLQLPLVVFILPLQEIHFLEQLLLVEFELPHDGSQVLPRYAARRDRREKKEEGSLNPTLMYKKPISTCDVYWRRKEGQVIPLELFEERGDSQGRSTNQRSLDGLCPPHRTEIWCSAEVGVPCGLCVDHLG